MVFLIIRGLVDSEFLQTMGRNWSDWEESFLDRAMPGVFGLDRTDDKDADVGPGGSCEVDYDMSTIRNVWQMQ